MSQNNRVGRNPFQKSQKTQSALAAAVAAPTQKQKPRQKSSSKKHKPKANSHVSCLTKVLNEAKLGIHLTRVILDMARGMIFKN